MLHIAQILCTLLILTFLDLLRISQPADYFPSNKLVIKPLKITAKLNRNSIKGRIFFEKSF